jgi:hypothetical protein
MGQRANREMREVTEKMHEVTKGIEETIKEMQGGTECMQ